MNRAFNLGKSSAKKKLVDNIKIKICATMNCRNEEYGHLGANMAL
jgi:hypothetical protein